MHIVSVKVSFDNEEDINDNEENIVDNGFHIIDYQKKQNEIICVYEQI